MQRLDEDFNSASSDESYMSYGEEDNSNDIVGDYVQQLKSRLKTAEEHLRAWQNKICPFESSAEHTYVVRLFNDEVHTFDEVMPIIA